MEEYVIKIKKAPAGHYDRNVQCSGGTGSSDTASAWGRKPCGNLAHAEGDDGFRSGVSVGGGCRQGKL